MAATGTEGVHICRNVASFYDGDRLRVMFQRVNVALRLCSLLLSQVSPPRLVVQREYEYGANQHGNTEGKNQPFPCTKR